MRHRLAATPLWVALLALSTSSLAETIHVTTTDPAINAESAPGVPADCDSEAPTDNLSLELLCPDGSDGHVSPCEAADISLAEAICAANLNPGPDTIVLEAGATYTLTEAHNSWLGYNGLPFVTSDITIEGNGATIERDSTANRFRLFAVSGHYVEAAAPSVGQEAPVGSLTLSDLTLKGGLARGGNGGLNGGGGAGLGGAIFSMGDLTIEGVTLSENTAQGGRGGVSSLGGCGAGGLAGHAGISAGGGFGGHPDGRTVNEERYQGRGGGFGEPGDPGEFPDGRFSTGGATDLYTNGEAGGFGAGAACNYQWWETHVGGFGGGGVGGGSSHFGGGTGANFIGGEHGGDGLGGALFHMDGVLTVVNSTVAANQAIGGASSERNNHPGIGRAGGLYVLNGTARIAFTTFAHNTADETSDLAVHTRIPGPSSFYAMGGGAPCGVTSQGVHYCTPTAADVQVESSVFASPGVVGPLRTWEADDLSGGGNLVSASATDLPDDFALADTTFTVAPLSDYGGDQWTVPLPADQPAIAGDCVDTSASTVDADQRGRRRPTTACDPGAYQRPPSCAVNDDCDVGTCVEGVCCTGCEGLDAGCASCLESTGAVADGLCTFAEEGSTCGDDDSDCRVPDTCDDAGTCIDNGNIDDGTTCDDGLWCTVTDTCASGACVGADDPCSSDETCIEEEAFCSVSCGDGEITDDEECDDGDENSDYIHDSCRTDCTLPRCGDGIVDSGEECDGGFPDVPCADDCTIILPSSGDTGDESEASGGCGCVASGPSAPSLAWLLGVGVVLIRRRQRR